MIIALIAIVLTLTLVVGFHEAGHAIAAKICGVTIQRISIGFGKPILMWKSRQGCEWVWAMWPLGGYVNLLNTRIAPIEEQYHQHCFDKQPLWVRLFILLAGGLANLLVAGLALTIYFMFGFIQDTPLVQMVEPNSIAANAGIIENDRIIEIAGQKTKSWQDVGMGLIVNLGKQPVGILVENTAHEVRKLFLDLSNVPVKGKKSLFAAIGLELNPKKITHESVAGVSFTEAVSLAFTKSFQLLVFFMLMLKQVVTGAVSFAMLLGPASMLALTVASFSQGVAIFLYFIASLSLAVGLVNLFPVPSLDGGSIVYAILEKVRGKPISVAMEILLQRLVMIALSILLLQLAMNDMQRYLQ